MSQEAHAGCLAFEFAPAASASWSIAGCRSTNRESWRQVARATAAHSTVTFNNASSCRFREDGPFRQIIGSPMVDGPTRVAIARSEHGDSLVLRASHDGYSRRFGIIHQRAVMLTAGGDKLEGEDVFMPAHGEILPHGARDEFAVRFHLHPAIKASRRSDGHGAMLVLPNKDVWTFDAHEDRVELEESVYLRRLRGSAPDHADRDPTAAPARCRACTGPSPTRRAAAPKKAGDARRQAHAAERAGIAALTLTLPWKGEGRRASNDSEMRDGVGVWYYTRSCRCTPSPALALAGGGRYSAIDASPLQARMKTEPNAPLPPPRRARADFRVRQDRADRIRHARLSKLGIEIVSTGGTAKAIADAGLKVVDVSELTGFPEMMDGRVKTLHPKVHGGLLAIRDNKDHAGAMKTHGIKPIDLLVVSLYPFEATVAKGAGFEDCIENIDIGGPAMIRAAAKNHDDVAVIVDAADYAPVLDALKAGGTTLDLRRRLAAKAYARTAAYDAAISNWFAGATERDRADVPRVRRQAGRGACATARTRIRRRRSIARPEQRSGVATARQVQGKQLSYNNINDTDAAYECVAEFDPARSRGLRDRQARQSVRRRGGRDAGGGLSQGAGLRFDLGLRRHRRAQPHARCRMRRASSPRFSPR